MCKLWSHFLVWESDLQLMYYQLFVMKLEFLKLVGQNETVLFPKSRQNKFCLIVAIMHEETAT